MTDNMFDKFVRDKLKDHQTAVPAGLWEKIAQRKDKDRKGGFLSKGALFTALLLLVITSGIVYWSLEDNAWNESLSQVKDPALHAANDNKDGSGMNEADIENREKNSGNNHTNQTADQVLQHEKINGENIIKTSKNNVPLNALHEDEDDFENTTSGQSEKENKYPIDLKNKSGKRNTNSAIGKNNTNVGAEFSLTTSNTSVSLHTQTQQSFNRLMQGKTANKIYTLGQFDENRTYSLSELKITGIDCPPNSRPGRNDWYLEVYGSPDFAFKSVKATSNTGYLSKKDSSETPQLSYTAGFRVSKSIGEHLLIKTGLQYSQINERFDLRTENERRITTVIIIRTIIGQNGTDSTVRDTTTVEQIGYSVQRTYNKYRSIDIPLLLSYEFGNEKLKFAINAGAIINLRSWYSGNTLNDSMAVVSIDSKSSGLYKQNIGVGLYAGLSIIKPVSKRFDVFLEPHFRYNLTNMSKTAGYSQRFNAAGLSFGIRYRINRQRSGIN